MQSSRLPGKVLAPLGELPALDHLVQRLQSCSFIDDIVIASTWHPADDALAAFGQERNLSVFRGSEDDVLGRLASLTSIMEPEFTVKVTGDCPLIDPLLIEQVFNAATSAEADMVSNAIIRSFPDGMDCTVLLGQPLLKAAALAKDPLEREHPTLFLRRNPELFNLVNILAPTELHRPELGLTLDTPEDLALLDDLARHFSTGSFPTCGQMIDYVNDRPDLLRINEHVKRRGDS